MLLLNELLHAASIRHAAADDIPACAELAWAAGHERDRAGWRDALRDDLMAPGRHLSVAEAGGTIVGYGRAMLFLPAAVLGPVAEHLGPIPFGR